MKAIIAKASDWDYVEKREFNTLDELLEWKKEIGEDIIIADSRLDDYDYYITIYDDYIE